MKPAIALLAWLMMTTPALAQVADTASAGYSGEIVVDRAGGIVEPWKATKTCPGAASDITACRAVIINSRTREVAKLGEKWSSKFAPTGVGLEVRRLESTMDTAKRLASSPKLKTQ